MPRRRILTLSAATAAVSERPWCPRPRRVLTGLDLAADLAQVEACCRRLYQRSCAAQAGLDARVLERMIAACRPGGFTAAQLAYALRPVMEAKRRRT